MKHHYPWNILGKDPDEMTSGEKAFELGVYITALILACALIGSLCIVAATS